MVAGRGVEAQSACGPCGDGYCDGYPCETDDTRPYDCQVGNTCWSNSGCSYGEICMDNQCQPGWQGGMCFDYTDCLQYYYPDQECSGGYCVPGRRRWRQLLRDVVGLPGVVLLRRSHVHRQSRVLADDGYTGLV